MAVQIKIDSSLAVDHINFLLQQAGVVTQRAIVQSIKYGISEHMEHIYRDKGLRLSKSVFSKEVRKSLSASGSVVSPTRYRAIGQVRIKYRTFNLIRFNPRWIPNKKRKSRSDSRGYARLRGGLSVAGRKTFQSVFPMTKNGVTFYVIRDKNKPSNKHPGHGSLVSFRVIPRFLNDQQEDVHVRRRLFRKFKIFVTQEFRKLSRTGRGLRPTKLTAKTVTSAVRKKLS